MWVKVRCNRSVLHGLSHGNSGFLSHLRSLLLCVFLRGRHIGSINSLLLGAIVVLSSPTFAYHVHIVAINATTTSYSTVTTDYLQSCTITILATPGNVVVDELTLPAYIEDIYGKCPFRPKIYVSMPCGDRALTPGEAFSTICYSEGITYMVTVSRGLPAPALFVVLTRGFQNSLRRARGRVNEWMSSSRSSRRT